MTKPNTFYKGISQVHLQPAGEAFNISSDDAKELVTLLNHK